MWTLFQKMFQLSAMSCSFRSQYCSVFVLLSLLLSSGLLQVESQNNNYMFPSFTSIGDFITMGDIQFSRTNSSLAFNAAGTAGNESSCGEVFLKDKVLLKDSATGRFDSFSTVFTISISAPVSNPGGTFAFWVGDANITQFESYTNNISSCALLTPSNYRFFAVDFNTVHRGILGNLSNNHIDVLENNVQPVQTYDLCGGNTTICSFLVNSGHLTAWIDYDGKDQSLEVRLTNGSYPSVQKPAEALINITNVDLSNITKDDAYLYAGFAGYSGFYDLYPMETKLLSWSFSTSSTSKTSSTSNVKTIALILGICGPVAAVVLVIVFLGYFCRRRKFSKKKDMSTLTHLVGARVFTYKELNKATKNFSISELLGSGGAGDVYKGTLQPNGTLVAVKRIKHESMQGEEAFLAEASSISQIRHKNLVQLQGWCQENGKMLLIYDYMCNGSLNDWLFENGFKSYKAEVLTLELRQSILAGVAAALEYLHEDCLQCILHRDIKSSNVMLDSDFNAHLGDFGLARLVEHKKLEKTTLMAGTLGYMAPEMPYTGKATKEADVYSFGVLILEVVCGRRPLDMHATEHEDLVLLNTVWRARETGNLSSQVDPKLIPECEPKTAIEVEVKDAEIGCDSDPVSHVVDVTELNMKMAQNLLCLGLLCCLPDPSARPSIRAVKQILQHIYELDDEVDTLLQSLPMMKPHGLFTLLEYSEAANSMSNTSSSGL